MAYDPSTDAGFVRLQIADTEEPPLFSDAEITAFLSRGNGSVFIAAGMAVRAIIADKAKLSKRIERAGYKSEQHGIDTLLELASSLEAQSGGLVIGTLDGGDYVFENFRPGWTDVAGEEATS